MTRIFQTSFTLFPENIPSTANDYESLLCHSWDWIWIPWRLRSIFILDTLNDFLSLHYLKICFWKNWIYQQKWQICISWQLKWVNLAAMYFFKHLIKRNGSQCKSNSFVQRFFSKSFKIWVLTKNSSGKTFRSMLKLKAFKSNFSGWIIWW